MAARRVSEPDPATLELAASIYEAGRRHYGIPEHDCKFPETKFTDPDALADVIIDLGCREVQAQDMHAHGNVLPKGSLGSQAQSIHEKERLHQAPEPRAAQLVRQRVHADWMLTDERLNRLADRVIALGLTPGAPGGAEDAEAAARRALDVARRQLAAAEGNHVTAGGQAAEVDAAYDTFDPPIRRHALAAIVVRKLAALRRAGGQGKAQATQQGLVAEG